MSPLAPPKERSSWPRERRFASELSFHAWTCSAGPRVLNDKVRFHRAVVNGFGYGEEFFRPVRRTLLVNVAFGSAKGAIIVAL
jgi:hypothetical protein